jgi:hypothetical protein
VLAVCKSDSGFPSVGGEKAVERVLFSGGAGVGAGAIDVSLRGDHGLVAKELHQRVDADIGVGELGGEGMAQAMYQCT